MIGSAELLTNYFRNISKMGGGRRGEGGGAGGVEGEGGGGSSRSNGFIAFI